MKASSVGSPASIQIDWPALSAALRAQVFAVKSTDLGDTVRPGLYGVLIDTALIDEVVTLVVLADGSVSLYVTDGSGCIGCGSHPEVASAASELLRVAQLALPAAGKTTNKSLPPANSVRCFFLTADGLCSAQTPLKAAYRSDLPLGALHVAGLHLLQTIERTGAGRSLQVEFQMAARERTVAQSLTRGVEACLSVGSAARRLRI